MILLVDNYDSFTYNLVHLLPDTEIVVLRNDDQRLLEVARKADGIILSPGPGKPSEAGDLEKLIRLFYQTKPILGICLGHQAIGEVFGATIEATPTIMHGKRSVINHKQIMRYHSLIVSKDHFPEELCITLEVEGCIMALKHREYPIYGLQFHPESIGTENGEEYLTEFLQKAGIVYATTI